MAYFNSIVTAAGAALLTDVMTSGGEVNIIAAAIGTGTPSGEPAELTALISPVSVGEIILREKYISQGAPTTLIIPVDVSNLGLTAELPVREIGVFAQGETGRVLFAYSWFEGEDGSNILPVPKDPTAADAVHSFEIGVFVTNQEAAAVTVTVSDAAYVTAEQFENLTPEDIGAVSTHDIIQESDLIAWADKQTISGSFLVSPAITTVNLPTNSWFIGYLDIVAGGKRITMTDLNAYRNWYNVTRENVFSGWREIASATDFLPLDGGTLGGSLSVNHGSGTFLSWLNDTEAGSSINSYIGETTGRLEVITTASEARVHLSFFDGADWFNYRLLHEGNSPAVVATATLTE